MPDQEREDVRIEVHDNSIVEAHLVGRFLIGRFMEQSAVAVEACRVRKISLLLLNTTGMQGTPTTMDRFDMGVLGAVLAEGLKVAGYAHPDFLDPGKFAAVVARNRGLNVDVFTDREKALAWLRKRDP